MTRSMRRRWLLVGAALFMTGPLAAQDETPPAPAESPERGETPSVPDPRVARIASDEMEAKALTAATNVIKARNARDAELAAALVGPLGSVQGAQGDVKADDEARSVVEATLLSALALDRAADAIGMRLCTVVRRSKCSAIAINPGTDRRASAVTAAPPPEVSLVAINSAQSENPTPETDNIGGVSSMDRDKRCAEIRRLADPAPPAPDPKPVVIIDQSTTSLTDLADSFMVRTTALGREFCSALEDADDNADLEGGSAAAIGAVVNTLANLFRADYQVYGIPVAIDQSLLTKRVAISFMSRGPANPVYMPGLSPLGPNDESNPALRRLAILDALRIDAVGHKNLDSQDRLQKVVEAYDEVLAALTTQEADQPPLISAIVRQAALSALLRQGSYLVVTNVHMMGGTSYSKKNFFTFLGGMPYFVSGSALASYIVLDSRTGRTLDTVTIPVTSGFHRANALDRLFIGTTSGGPGL